MTDYVKSTNFASKDSLATGNPLKIVKGTEIDTEFNNIATAVATKADIVSPTFTGTPSAPTASTGTNSTQLATTAFVSTAVANSLVNPVVNTIVYEGTVDDYETTLSFADPTSDRSIVFPNKSGTVAFTSELPSASLVSDKSGTYAIAGSSTLTVTITAHGWAIGDQVYLNFTSGTASDNYFTITGITTNTFTVDYGSTLTTSGNVTSYYSTLGTVYLTSSDEAVSGISSSRAVTPAGVKAAITDRLNITGSAPVFGARSWVNFDGTGTVGANQTIIGSGNVASVYKNSTGNYTITFTTALPSANYCVVGTSADDNASLNTVIALYSGDTKTTTSVQVRCKNPAGDTFIDSNSLNIVVFG